MHLNIVKHTAKPLTIRAASEIIKGLEMTLRHRDGEYRVNFKGGAEATAYHTTDLSDAVFTALSMGSARTAEKLRDIAEHANAIRLTAARTH